MLKDSAYKRILISTISFIIVILLCLFPKDESNITEEIIKMDNITLPVYLIDDNNYVSRVNAYKKNNDVEYIIDLLTIDSLSSAYIPSSFKGIIPSGTKIISYNIDNGLLKIDFSKEILNVSIKNSRKMIEAITYSLLEIDNIEKIMILVEGNILENLPNGEKIPTILDKNFGINKVSYIDNIKNTKMVTIYYLSKKEDTSYFIPISKTVNSEKEKIEIVINEMKKTPVYSGNLISYLNASIELKGYEFLENSINMSFDNTLLVNLKEEDIVETVKYMISLSINDTYNLKNMAINIS